MSIEKSENGLTDTLVGEAFLCGFLLVVEGVVTRIVHREKGSLQGVHSV